MKRTLALLYVAAILGAAIGCGSGKTARPAPTGSGGAPVGTGTTVSVGGGDAGPDSGLDGSSDAASCVAWNSPFGINASDDADQLALAQDAGFTWHRTESLWMNIEWNQGQLDASGELAKVGANRDAGLQMLDQLPVSAR